MKLIIFFVALASASAVLANPIKDAKSMALIKRNADGLEESTMEIRDVIDQFEEVGLVKRRRHKKHGRRGRGRKGKGMMAMPPPAAMGGGAGMAGGDAGAGMADMSAAQ